MLSPDVERAIQELRESFPGHDLAYVEDGQGGARVTMQGFATGADLKPETTWVGFAITFQYPATDVYPHFVRPDLARSDGRALEGEGMSVAAWDGKPAIQLSRRSNRWRQGQDTAAIKLTKVIDWLRTR
jgi:hypothetical protein